MIVIPKHMIPKMLAVLISLTATCRVPRLLAEQAQTAEQTQSAEQTVPNDVLSRLPALNDPTIADQMISVNFEDTDIRLVLKTISDITGINFIIDDNIKGTVTVLSPSKIRVGDLYNFLQSILEVKGYVALPAADHVKIKSRNKAAQENLQIRIGSDPDKIPQDDSVVTQIMPVKYANATEISQILTPRLPADAHMTVYRRTNTIVITATSANIHHIAEIIKEFDVPGAQEELLVIPLKHAGAQILSKQINEIMSGSAGSAPTGNRRITRNIEVRGRPQIQPDTRTNSLIVTANPQDSRTIRELVQKLDIIRPEGTMDYHVVPLKNAEAKAMAESLNQSLADLNQNARDGGPIARSIKITQDEGTNSLIIRATPQDFEVVKSIIDQLDIERELILVEMKIIEVSDENLREIGIDWQTLDEAVSNSVRVFAQSDYGIRVDQANGDLNGLSIGAFKKVGGNVKIAGILNALEKESGVNILSTPQLVTSNNQVAKFLVGENIPYVTNSRITETDPSTPTVIKTIDYKDVGIDMEITPHINPGGLIRLKINSQFTQVIEGVSGLSADTPTTSKRQLSTYVTMSDGSTLVIGGLIRDDKITLEHKIPLLGDIPLLGGLFRYKRDRITKTNLLLFITPHLLTKQEKITQLNRDKLDKIRQIMKKHGQDTAPIDDISFGEGNSRRANRKP